MLVLALAALLATTPEPSPDRVFLNGRVWTGERERPRAEALAVRGDRLTAVGTTAAVRAMAGPDTEVVDLAGAFVVPGFNDAHIHLLVVPTIELEDAMDVASVQERVRSWAVANPDAPWIRGRGWYYAAFPGGTPHRRLLDEAVPDRPAFLTSYDGHTGWANSRALAVAGITRDTPDPEDGAIVRDESGEPTGVLEESAMRLVGRLLPPHTEEERYAALKLRLDQAAAFGLTSVQNASALDLPVFERVLREGGMKVRVRGALPLLAPPAPDSEELARYRELRARWTGPSLKLGILKGMLDGVVEAKTAAMFDEYATGGGRGHANWTQEDLDRAVAFWDKEGFQVQLHAIGDRAIAMALDAFQRAAAVNGSSSRRHRVEHIETIRPSDLPRFAALGVVASTQAMFVNPDRNTLEVYAPNLGADRASRAMAFRMLDEAGAVQAFGSDYPVFTMNPLRGIYAAVTRQTAEGTPPGGWQPHQRIGVEAALRHFTADAAFASFDEDDKGTLAVGKLADFAVLSEDITAVPPARILETRVLRTVMGGRDTFVRTTPDR